MDARHMRLAELRLQLEPLLASIHALNDELEVDPITAEGPFAVHPDGLLPVGLPAERSFARLLVEDDDLEGAAVVAVLLSPDGRVIVQRRTVAGGG